LVTKSLETVQWMKSRGVKFQPSYGRQAFKVDGKYRFWGGLCVETWGGGEGLIELETKAAEANGIDIKGPSIIRFSTSKRWFLT